MATIYELPLPDGTIVEVEGERPPTREEWMRAIGPKFSPNPKGGLPVISDEGLLAKAQRAAGQRSDQESLAAGLQAAQGATGMTEELARTSRLEGVRQQIAKEDARNSEVDRRLNVLSQASLGNVAAIDEVLSDVAANKVAQFGAQIVPPVATTIALGPAAVTPPGVAAIMGAGALGTQLAQRMRGQDIAEPANLVEAGVTGVLSPVGVNQMRAGTALLPALKKGAAEGLGIASGVEAGRIAGSSLRGEEYSPDANTALNFGLSLGLATGGRAFERAVAPKPTVANDAAQAASRMRQGGDMSRQSVLTGLSTGEGAAVQPTPFDDFVAGETVRKAMRAEDTSAAAKERILQQLVDDNALADANREAARRGVTVNSMMTELSRNRIMRLRQKHGNNLDAAIEELTTRLEKSAPPLADGGTKKPYGRQSSGQPRATVTNEGTTAPAQAEKPAKLKSLRDLTPEALGIPPVRDLDAEQLQAELAAQQQALADTQAKAGQLAEADLTAAERAEEITRLRAYADKLRSSIELLQAERLPVAAARALASAETPQEYNFILGELRARYGTIPLEITPSSPAARQLPSLEGVTPEGVGIQPTPVKEPNAVQVESPESPVLQPSVQRKVRDLELQPVEQGNQPEKTPAVSGEAVPQEEVVTPPGSYSPDDVQAMLDESAPYSQTGQGYNRNIAAARNRLKSVVDRGLSQSSVDEFANELRIRLDAEAKRAAEAAAAPSAPVAPAPVAPTPVVESAPAAPKAEQPSTVPDLADAIKRRNVEPDGKIYIGGKRVDATPENVSKAVSQSRYNNANEEVDALLELKQKYPNANIAEIREIGYKTKLKNGRPVIERDSSVSSWDNAIAKAQLRADYSAQYIKDVEDAGLVFADKQKQKVLDNYAQTPQYLKLRPEEKAAIAVTNMRGSEMRAPGIFYIPDKLMTATRRKELSRGGPLVEVKAWAQVTGNPYDNGWAIIDKRVEVLGKNEAPIPVEIVEKYGKKLPEGYSKKGDVYVYSPFPQKPEASVAAAPIVEPKPVVEPVAAAPKAKAKPETDPAQELSSFMEDVDGADSNLASPNTLRSLVKKAVDKGYITKMEGDDIMAIQKSMGGPEDTTDAFSELRSYLANKQSEMGKAAAAAPVEPAPAVRQLDQPAPVAAAKPVEAPAPASAAERANIRQQKASIMGQVRTAIENAPETQAITPEGQADLDIPLVGVSEASANIDALGKKYGVNTNEESRRAFGLYPSRNSGVLSITEQITEAIKRKHGDFVTIKTEGGAYRIPNDKASLSNFERLIENKYGKGISEPTTRGASTQPKAIPSVAKKVTPDSVTKSLQTFASTDPTRPAINSVVKDGPFTVSTDGRVIAVAKNGGGTPIADLTDQYPNWRRVIPSKMVRLTDTGFSAAKSPIATIDTGDIIRTLNQVETILPEKPAGVLLHIEDGKVGISFEDVQTGEFLGEGVSSLQKGQISFRPEFLKNVAESARKLGVEKLSVVAEDAAINSSKPLTFFADDKAFYVVMPMNEGKAVAPGIPRDIAPLPVKDITPSAPKKGTEIIRERARALKEAKPSKPEIVSAAEPAAQPAAPAKPLSIKERNKLSMLELKFARTGLNDVEEAERAALSARATSSGAARRDVRYRDIGSSGPTDDLSPKTGEELIAFEKASSNRVMARNPELAVAAVRLKNGVITAEEYADLVDELDPFIRKGPDSIPDNGKILEYMSKTAGATKQNKNGIRKVDKIGEPIDDGKLVELRIDIPTYNESTKSGDTVYAITAHEPVSEAATSVGEPISYLGIASVENPTFVTRSISGKGEAIDIAIGSGKFPLATVKGNYKSISSLPEDILDTSVWTEVGYNPVRSSSFVDVGSKKAVTGGSEAIMVGSRVFVKNAKLADRPVGITFGKRYSPLGYGITDIVDDIKAGNTKTPLKSLNKVIEDANNFRNRVRDASERRALPRKQGKAAILESISIKRAAGEISEDEATSIVDFVNRVRDDAIGDTSISIRSKGVSNYDFADNLVTLFLNAQKGGLPATTAIHEFWHGLSRYIPDAEIAKIKKDYTSELNAYIKENPWFVPFVGRYKLTPEQYLEFKTLAPNEAASKLDPIRNVNGEIESYKIKFDKENYRYIMLDEFIAEKMTDLVTSKQAIPDTFIGKMSKVVKDFLGLIKAKMGRDPYENIYQLVTDKKNKLDLQRISSVEDPVQIYEPKEYDYSVRYSKEPDGSTESMAAKRGALDIIGESPAGSAIRRDGSQQMRGPSGQAGNVSVAAMANIASPVAGGAIGYNMVERKPGETEQEFNARRLAATVAGIVGGTAVGITSSALAKSFGKMEVRPNAPASVRKLAAMAEAPSDTRSLFDKAKQAFSSARGKTVAASDSLRKMQRDINAPHGLPVVEGSTSDLATAYDRVNAFNHHAAVSTQEMTNIRDSFDRNELPYANSLITALRLEDYAKARVRNQAALDAEMQNAQADLIRAMDANKALRPAIKQAEKLRGQLRLAKDRLRRDPQNQSLIQKANQLEADYKQASQLRDSAISEAKKIYGARAKMRSAQENYAKNYDKYRTGDITTQEALDLPNQMRQEIAAKFGQNALPKFDAAIQKWSDVMRRNLENLRDSGLISQNQFDATVANNEFYAPFRFLQEELDRIESGINTEMGTSGPVIRAREGFSRKDPKLQNMFEAARANIYDARIRAAQNRFMRDRLAPLTQLDPNGRFIKRVDPGHRPAAGRSVVRYKDNGETVALEVPTPVAESISGPNYDPGFVAKVLQEGNKLARLGQTAGDVVFLATQAGFLDPMRAQTMSNYSVFGGRFGIKPMAVAALPFNYARGLYSALKTNFFDIQDSLMKQAVQNDAISGSFFTSSDPRGYDLRQSVGESIKSIKSPVELLDTVSGIVTRSGQSLDQMTKLVGWQQALAQEKVTIPVATKTGSVMKTMSLKDAMVNPNVNPADIQEAISRAAYDVSNFYGSPNFSKKMLGLQSSSLLFTYIKAAVRGIETDARRALPVTDMANAVSGKPYDKARLSSSMKTLGRLAGFGAATAGIYAINMLPENREDFESIDKRERDRKIPIPLSKFTFEDGTSIVGPSTTQTIAEFLGAKQEPYRTWSKQENKWVREYFMVPMQGPYTMLSKDLAEQTMRAESEANPDFGSVATEFAARHIPVNVDGDSFKERMVSIASSVQPTLRLMPEMLYNINTFTQRPVITKNVEGSPELQFDPTRDPEFYRMAAKAVGAVTPDFLGEWPRSPQALKHILESYIGSTRMLNQSVAREGSVQQAIPIIGGRVGVSGRPEMTEKRDIAEQAKRGASDQKTIEDNAVDLVVQEFTNPSSDPELARRANEALATVMSSERAIKRFEEKLQSSQRGTSSEARMIAGLGSKDAKVRYYSGILNQMGGDVSKFIPYVTQMMNYGSEVASDEIIEQVLSDYLSNPPARK